MAHERQIELDDGRRLDLRLSGPVDGVPLLFHHGTPGAATPIRALERAAHNRGLRFATFSRPGYGSSSRLRGRRVVDVVQDAAAVLTAIEADRCLVAGWSGGGPHALACRARLGSAAGTLVISGVAPYGLADLDWVDGMGDDNGAEFGAALGEPGELDAESDGTVVHRHSVLYFSVELDVHGHAERGRLDGDTASDQLGAVRMMEQDPDAEFGDIENAALPPLLDGLALDMAAPNPARNLAWYSAAELHGAPPPRRLRHPEIDPPLSSMGFLFSEMPTT